MAADAPKGISARFASGWAYLKVPRKSGHSLEVENLLNGAWSPAHLHGSEYLLPMYADGRPTEWRARYVRAGEPGSWRTGRVSFPDTFVEDGDGAPEPDTKPAAPTGLRVVSQDAAKGSVLVAWDTAAVASWRVQLDGGNVMHADKPEFEFIGLTAGTTYSWSVRAVAADSGGVEIESDPATATFTVDKHEDPKPPPVPDGPGVPRNVRAHCITHQSTKVEWDRDPAVHEYEVWIDGHRDAAQHTQDTIVTVTGLKQLTEYTAHVVAHTRDGKQSAPGSVRFATGVPEPDPIPDPDADTAADWPAPDLMVWPLEGGKVRASWEDADDGQKPKGQMGYPYWHVSLDQKTWFFTKERQYEFEVLPGAEVMVSVYGVWSNTLTGIATKGVAL